MGRKPDSETLKVAKKLTKQYKQLHSKRKSDKVFQKDVKEVAKVLNREAKRIAKQTKGKKVLDVQKEIIRDIESL